MKQIQILEWVHTDQEFLTLTEARKKDINVLNLVGFLIFIECVII